MTTLAEVKQIAAQIAENSNTVSQVFDFEFLKGVGIITGLATQPTEEAMQAVVTENQWDVDAMVASVNSILTTKNPRY